jgi:hypothetical protein
MEVINAVIPPMEQAMAPEMHAIEHERQAWPAS